MTARPYALLSCAMSLDGYIDDTSDRRLLLSDAADLDRVDEVRASCDAILVGANTVRRDDPRLLIRAPARRAARLARGEPEHPIKVTLTRGGGLDPAARFFTTGPASRLVYAPAALVPVLRARIGDAAETVAAGDLRGVLADLATRGVRRLMVEGGTSMHTAFLAAGLADELHLVLAPRFVGDPSAPRFVDALTPSGRPMHLAEVRPIGDAVLLRYLFGDAVSGDFRSGDFGSGDAVSGDDG